MTYIQDIWTKHEICPNAQRKMRKNEAGNANKYKEAVGITASL